MTKKKTNTPAEPVHEKMVIRLTSDQRDLISRAANQKGLSPNIYARMAALERAKSEVGESGT